MEAVYRILRYLKSPVTYQKKKKKRYLKSPVGKGLLFARHDHLKVEGYTNANGVGSDTY
jgi:hypothetical protein